MNEKDTLVHGVAVTGRKEILEQTMSVRIEDDYYNKTTNHSIQHQLRGD